MNRKVLGFTLIELMVVIAIIGILAAIAVPFYQSYITRSRLTEVFSLASGLKPRVVESYALTKNCPDNSSGVANDGVLAPQDYKTAVIDNITVVAAGDGCNINVAIKADAPVASGARGKTVSLVMSAGSTSGSFQWDCTSDFAASDNNAYLPSVCHR